MDDIYIQRLKHLRNWLLNEWNKIPADKKDLNYWRTTNNDRIPTGFDLSNQNMKHQCNTVGCIIGWYTTNEDVTKDGLYYDMNTKNITHQVQKGRYKGETLIGQKAVRSYFNLNPNEFHALFMDTYDTKNPSAADIIARLDYVINANSF